MVIYGVYDHLPLLRKMTGRKPNLSRALMDLSSILRSLQPHPQSSFCSVKMLFLAQVPLYSSRGYYETDEVALARLQWASRFPWGLSCIDRPLDHEAPNNIAKTTFTDRWRTSLFLLMVPFGTFHGRLRGLFLYSQNYVALHPFKVCLHYIMWHSLRCFTCFGFRNPFPLDHGEIILWKISCIGIISGGFLYVSLCCCL